jgi:DNA-binding transcriptional LysR family regulator
MNIFHIKCFIALANCLNFSKAASQMNITQPAFSRIISLIEHEMGVNLFFRNKREVILTNAGEVYLDVGCKIVKLHEEGVDKAIEAEKGLIGKIKIGTLREQFNCQLPSTIKLFKDSFPNISVDFHEYSNSAMVEAFQNYEIDIGFTISPGLCVISDIIWRAQITFEHSVVTSNDHPLSSVMSVDISELIHERFIALDPNNFSSINQLILDICHTANFDPHFVDVASSLSGLMTLVECGEGITIVPYHFKDQFPHNVKFIKLSSQPCNVERVLAWRKSNNNPCLPIFLRKSNLDPYLEPGINETN